MRNKNRLVDFHKIVFSTFLNYFQEVVSFLFTYLYCKNTQMLDFFRCSKIMNIEGMQA